MTEISSYFEDVTDPLRVRQDTPIVLPEQAEIMATVGLIRSLSQRNTTSTLQRSAGGLRMTQNTVWVDDGIVESSVIDSRGSISNFEPQAIGLNLSFGRSNSPLTSRVVSVEQQFSPKQIEEWRLLDMASFAVCGTGQSTTDSEPETLADFSTQPNVSDYGVDRFNTEERRLVIHGIRQRISLRSEGLREVSGLAEVKKLSEEVVTGLKSSKKLSVYFERKPKAVFPRRTTADSDILRRLNGLLSEVLDS